MPASEAARATTRRTKPFNFESHYILKRRAGRHVGVDVQNSKAIARNERSSSIFNSDRSLRLIRMKWRKSEKSNGANGSCAHRQVRRFRRPGGGVTIYAPDEVLAPPGRERRTARSRETRSPHAAARLMQQSANVDQVLNDSFPASDPPSWTGAISRVAGTSTRQPINDRLTRRVRAEFLEMPGLCLTFDQAQRLWSLEPLTCASLLNALIDSGFLRRTARGLFVLCRPGV